MTAKEYLQERVQLSPRIDSSTMYDIVFVEDTLDNVADAIEGYANMKIKEALDALKDGIKIWRELT